MTDISNSKRIIFSIVVFLLVLAIIETPFQIANYLKLKEEDIYVPLISSIDPPQLTKKMLIPLRKDVLSYRRETLMDGGFRAIGDIGEAQLDEFKITLSEAMSLKTRTYSGKYRTLDSRYAYRTIDVNELGFRGPTWSQPKKLGDIRIFIVGDSPAFSFLSREDSSIHRLLEQILRKNGKNNIHVYCAAIPGSRAENVAWVIEKFISKASPDFVITVTGFNDAYRDSLPNAAEKVIDRLGQPFEFGDWQIQSAFLTTFSKYLSKAIRKPETFETQKMPPEVVADIYKKNLGLMKSSLDKVKAKLLVYISPSLTLPGLGKKLNEEERHIYLISNPPSDANFEVLYLINRWAVKGFPLLVKEISESGIPFFNGHAYERPDVTEADLFFRDSGHFTLLGNTHVAREIAKLLYENGLQK